MLHVDTNTIGEYEFGSVQGADDPVKVDGRVLTIPINGAPSLVLRNQDPLPGEATGTLRLVIDEALIDAPGWVAIHSNNNGSPGPVLATALLHTGSNKHIIIEVDAAAAGELVFPMLHYDTNTLGEYEFGTVDGADVPVSVNSQIVVAPLRLTSASAAEPTATPAPAANATGACTVTANGNVNRRTGPSTGFDIAGQLPVGQSSGVNAKTAPVNGFVWYRLTDNSFVREDVVTVSGDCSGLPIVAADQPPPAQQPPPPAATQGF